jgi:NAD(P)H-dependent FMN reductase
MMMDMKTERRLQKLAVIYGSNREGRLCDHVGRWAIDQIAAHGEYDVELTDPLTMCLPERLGSETGPSLTAFRHRLGRADAFLFVTPEYNHGYPSVLKLLIDSVNEEWKRKPAAFVCYGGQSGGLRAVEQLRLVLAELHVATMRDTVSFVNAWEQFDETGSLRDATRANAAIGAMLDQLAWWSRTLAAARNAEPLALSRA